MSYYVVHRNQSDRKLYIDEFDNQSEAISKRNDYMEIYHDSVILDQNDINELYLLMRQRSIRKQKEFYKKNNK